MKTLPKLSPTSYALLGLLARAPASAYELNSVMQTSMLRVFWPRAESHVYSEPKKLLAHALVSERRETVKSRPRTVFTITTKGRQALADWLATPDTAEHRSQAEFMLKVILAEGGTVTDVRATVDRANNSTEQDIDDAIAGIEQILADPAAYAAKGMPWNGIAANLMADILIARIRWARYAKAAVDTVPADGDRAEKEAIGRAAYQRALDRLKAERDQ